MVDLESLLNPDSWALGPACLPLPCLILSCLSLPCLVLPFPALPCLALRLQLPNQYAFIPIPLKQHCRADTCIASHTIRMVIKLSSHPTPSPTPFPYCLLSTIPPSFLILNSTASPSNQLSGADLFDPTQSLR